MTKIKELRIASGMTQEELAKKANVKLATLQKLECGAVSTANSKFETIMRLAEAMNQNPREFIDWPD